MRPSVPTVVHRHCCRRHKCIFVSFFFGAEFFFQKTENHTPSARRTNISPTRPSMIAMQSCAQKDEVGWRVDELVYLLFYFVIMRSQFGGVFHTMCKLFINVCSWPCNDLRRVQPKWCGSHKRVFSFWAVLSLGRQLDNVNDWTHGVLCNTIANVHCEGIFWEIFYGRSTL